MTCIKEFPHLVQMHRKYAGLGLAAVSVSLDDLTDPNPAKVREKVVRFLRAKGADFSNFLLDEKSEFWQQKLHIDGPPCVFVFDRDGKVAKQFKDEFSYEDVEKLVAELLQRR